MRNALPCIVILGLTALPLVAARAAVLTGNKSAARDYGLQSDSLCAGLEQKWGKDAYASYLRRPDIQNYRSQLAQVLTLGK